MPPLWFGDVSLILVKELAVLLIRQLTTQWIAADAALDEP
jgi:hypothetical protein